jgi:hypothetical protein
LFTLVQADDAVRELASINERYERVVSERDALQLRVAQLEQARHCAKAHCLCCC